MPKTRAELLRVLTAAAGLPMNIDQIMEQLPLGTERSKISDLCQELKAQGQVVATVEDGRVAYALAEPPTTASVSQLHGRRASDRESTIEKVRRLLEKATAPMTPAEVQAAIPEETMEKVQRALHRGKHRGEFESVRAGARAKAYAPKGGIAIAIAGDMPEVAATTPPPPAEPAAAPAVDAPPPAAASSVGAAPGVADIRELEKAVHAAEQARDAYLQTVVDPTTWWWLQESLRASQAALRALSGRA